MRLVTGISIVALLVAVASLVLISQLLFWGRSEPPNVNSPACAKLHAARAAVYIPKIYHFQPRPGTPIPEGWWQKWEEAGDEWEKTISEIDYQLALLNCY